MKAIYYSWSYGGTVVIACFSDDKDSSIDKIMNQLNERWPNLKDSFYVDRYVPDVLNPKDISYLNIITYVFDNENEAAKPLPLDEYGYPAYTIPGCQRVPTTEEGNKAIQEIMREQS